jgi:hypothetical protein
MADTTAIALNDLILALDRCMKANPQTGNEHCMHPDANAMADPFAVMVVGRLPQLDVALLKPAAVAAYGRWSLGRGEP